MRRAVGSDAEHIFIENKWVSSVKAFELQLVRVGIRFKALKKRVSYSQADVRFKAGLSESEKSGCKAAFLVISL